MRGPPFAALLVMVLLAGCGADEPARSRRAGPEGDALPKPATTARSVTGMPEPGTAQPRPEAAPLPAPETVEVAGPDQPELVLGDAPSGDAQQAVEVVRAYYAAINGRDYAGAHARWSDGGRASGQTLEQFAAGFEGTAGVSVEIGTPGRVEGAAGSRHVEVPVSLEARQQDGSLRRFAGRYVLRRSVVDGATPQQQAWHIASAELGEVQP